MKFASNLDGLTGLPSRRKFDVFYQHVWQQACEKAEPLAVILMDVDWFKDLNDQYGHQAGDDCLRRIARILEQVPGNSQEIAARYGGEEFVIALLGIDGQRALAVAQRIGKAIENDHPQQRGRPVRLQPATPGWPIVTQLQTKTRKTCLKRPMMHCIRPRPTAETTAFWPGKCTRP